MTNLLQLSPLHSARISQHRCKLRLPLYGSMAGHWSAAGDPQKGGGPCGQATLKFLLTQQKKADCVAKHIYTCTHWLLNALGCVCKHTMPCMDAEALSSARVLHLIRQAQVVDELLQGSLRVGVKVTERVVSYVEGGEFLSALSRALL